jgi:uncharacterized cupredoxin-like copper-binding protein
MKKMRVRLAAGLLVALATGLVVGTGTGAAAPSATPAPVKITVTATEFSFKFSKNSIPKPGTTVIFTVINKGTIAHDLEFKTLNKKTKLLQPKQKTTLTVKFTKKGSFYYLCTVPRHAEEGMAGSFKVL